MKAMIWLAIVFLVVGSIAYLAMRGNVRPHHISFGADPTYTVKDVQDLMHDPDAQVHRVISPGLFPYDLVFLICLGALLALISLLIVPHTNVLAGSACLLLVFPLLYMVFDFTENCLLAWMLSSHPTTLTNRFLAIVKTATWLKLGFVALSFLQVFYLLGAWALRAFKLH